ncbi:N-acetylmuramoyl-L-alanine amidase [Thermoleptolyngbya sichuanensis XZ-Cy5]|uniref:N-acetylmuramoyl-L-alanine amidase n=1 Tax=Thermoleptolyngbya sichuanensis TaxID=2885951 RepID=UPI00240E90F7|nr:N-acetylmuramoyl-L-alanine amidase [Thermoleptolyngbya sichuanensis XZ-Cy5]
MRFSWLLSGVLGVAGSLLIAVSAEAGTLQSWRFNSAENRLVFTTDDGVQPRAQLISDPVRLVIDLPGITLGRSTTRQSGTGGIREIRLGQVDAQTTRIVIELMPGYTLDPQRVLVRGATPTDWSVQIPTPQFVGGPVAGSPSPTPGTPLPAPNPPAPAPAPPAAGPAQIDEVQITQDGFFIRTSGGVPRLTLRRNSDPRDVQFDIANAQVSPQLTNRDLRPNHRGVERLRLEPQRNGVVRLSLRLEGRRNDRNRRGWQASVSDFGGIVLLPSLSANSGVVATRPSQPAPTPLPPTIPPITPPTSPSPPPRPSQPPVSGLSTVQSVELSSNGQQLLIRADQPITYTSDWDRGRIFYRITIPDARLAERVIGPQITANSTIQQVRLLQEDERTVAILVQPAAGVVIRDVIQPSDRLLALELRGAAQSPAPPMPTTPPPIVTPPTTTLPRVPTGRVVVVLDAGHGGRDPGAVGIGGIREKDIVLSITTQVARLLEQQGVQVVMTRTDDREIDLAPRVQIAERARANIFVSIHANAISMDRPDVNGIETYYASEAGARLGRVIHDSMVRNTGLNDRGLRSARFYVIRNTSMPAVLLETGFVTGAQDAAFLSSAQGRERMAFAIAQGILQYIQQNF